MHHSNSLKEFKTSSASEEDKDYNRRFDPKNLALSIHTNPEGTKHTAVRDRANTKLQNTGRNDKCRGFGQSPFL